MTKQIRVLIADDHALFRRGLVELLSEEPDFILVGEARSGPEVVQLSYKVQADIILMDVHMPGGNGVEAVQSLKRTTSNVRVLMLTISNNDEDLLNAIRAGADGYLLKSAEPDELCTAIRRVAAGQAFLSQDVVGVVMRAAASAENRQRENLLTPRELEVLTIMARGATNAEIATALVISPNTVKTHIKRIYEKLNATNRTEAAARAAAMGLLA